MKQPTKGFQRARNMRKWADRKGGFPATPDQFDRSDITTLASRMDQWMLWQKERAYSGKTIEMRTWAISCFIEWAGERELHYPEKITKPILEGYQRAIFNYRKADGNPLGVTTQRQRIGAIQNFFTWLCRRGILQANPAADLDLPRKPNRVLPRTLSAHEIQAILDVPDVTDLLGIRDRAILETLYSSGIRRGECARIDIDDVDLQLGTILVRKGKGQKDRVVPLGQRAAYWIAKYLEHTRPKLETHSSERALFISGYGERFNINHIGNWVRKTIAAASIGRKASCHTLRHSCATHMLENGADIRFIQQQLGHARLDTTQIYTEVSIVKLREVHARTHPHGLL